jgi:C1A family cysteine protease
MEGADKIKSGNLKSLSEQQLVDCDVGDGNMGCSGGDMFTAIQYAATNGMVSEADYPYAGIDQNCQADGLTVVSRPLAAKKVNPNSAVALETAIVNGPVSVAIEADTFVFQFYSGGILNSKACGTNLDHGVVAVGYGDLGTAKPYYIVRNSWGTSWGLSGYINIAIVEGQGICGIQMEPVYAQY